MDDDVEAPLFQSRIKKGEIDEKASSFLLSTKNLLCFANYKKPIKKARKNYNRRESFSSFLIMLGTSLGDTYEMHTYRKSHGTRALSSQECHLYIRYLYTTRKRM